MRPCMLMILAGCWSNTAQPEAVKPAATPPLPAGYCPFNPLAGPWLDELFPACPPPQFGYAIAFCGPRNQCPRPCGAVITGYGALRTAPSVASFTYDTIGQWVSTIRDQELRASCTFERGRRATCDYFGTPMSVVRDAAMRITAIIDDGQTREIRYDARGKVIAIGDRTFEYDDRGNMLRDGAAELEYDPYGRVVRAAHHSPDIEDDSDGDDDDESPVEPGADSAPPMIDRFTYDARNLVRVVRPRSRTTTTLTYDRADRIVKLAADSPDSTVHVAYQYECR